MLATPGERGVIGRGQSETQHPEDRRQEAFSLPQGQVEDEPERQRGFDGEIGILPLPATFADPHGLPSGDRIRGQPHGDIAALDQRSVVCRPISDVVFCLVLWVHSRLHVEIMHLLSPRWPGGRSWLTEGAGSVHQRHGGASLEGEVATAMLGVDSRWGRWRAGVVASHSRGQGTYTPPTTPGGAVAALLHES